MKKIKAAHIVAIALVLAVSCLFVACTVTPDHEVKDQYTVTYNLNYEGAAARTVQVPAGTRTTAWRPTRSGYTLEGWFTDAACSTGKEFDFMTYINSDTTLWAKWEKNAEKLTVTFDYNYAGSGSAATASVTENSLISEDMIPSCPRLGMQYKGWYKDDKCTQEWNFATDTVSSAITLYADYAYDSSVPRDRDGNIVYDNVTVTIWSGADFSTNDVLNKLVTKFNFLHSGEISIVIDNGGMDGTKQNLRSLRKQQVANVNDSAAANYYSITDVYDLAGISFDASDYYADAIRDCYIGEKQYSVPIATSVPFLIYNKELMAKYNGDNDLPTNYTEFKELLLKAYEGEIASKSDFKTILTGYDWTFKEGASATPFLQNDADYYVYENGAYVNKWGALGSASFAKAETAMGNLYDLFGAQGACKGGLGSGSDYEDSAVRSAVESGNAFMGLINIGPNSRTVAANSSFGVMPLSGLFADADKAQLNQIAVSSIGFQFYKASQVPLIELAAGALFVDYVCQNSVDFAVNGWYPIQKSVAESEAFTSLDIYKTVLKDVGDPNNFRTFDGFISQKAIVNSTCAETYIVPMLQGPAMSAEDLTIDTFAMKSSILSQNIGETNEA